MNKIIPLSLMALIAFFGFLLAAKVYNFSHALGMIGGFLIGALYVGSIADLDSRDE